MQRESCFAEGLEKGPALSKNENNACIEDDHVIKYFSLKGRSSVVLRIFGNKRVPFLAVQPRKRHERLYLRRNIPMDLMQALRESQVKENRPEVAIGDFVKVHVKVKEGSRERIQVFEGTVIAKKHGGVEETFTVRRVSYGVGVEKIFPVNSPIIDKVEVVRHGKVRRAKLYYLRGRVGKAAKVKEKI